MHYRVPQAGGGTSGSALDVAQHCRCSASPGHEPVTHYLHQLLCPKLPCPTELEGTSWTLVKHIFTKQRGEFERTGLSSAPQTGKDQVAASAIYSLRFMKLCFVSNFKTTKPKQTVHSTALFLNPVKCTGLLCFRLPAPFVCSNMQRVVRAS